ncbi:MAG: malate synthase G, partial [Gammaproteobacteria bacterium]
MSDNYISKGSLSVSSKLANFVSEELLPGLDITPENFWDQLGAIINNFAPRNKELLVKRESLQEQIDQWHLSHKGKPHDPGLYKIFLKDIGYLIDVGGDFQITTQNVDPEIAIIAGPQLVVPVMNARFALNAANARWGSLYDALYGT